MQATIIIFGASGNLTKKKLIPALYALVKVGKLSNYAIIGCAKDTLAVAAILDSVKEEIRDFEEKVWIDFTERFFYHIVDFNRREDFVQFKSFIENIEHKHGLPGSRLIYLATSSTFFCTLTERIATIGLAQRIESNHLWYRIVYEKPFGHDLQSAHALNECIANYFDEQQIFRIDHFLTKELASNIALLRFANCVFEPLWDNRYVHQVTIIADEKETIAGRGMYYDQYGALRDVVQNHILQLLALVTMEAPAKLAGEQIRDERARVLEQVRFIDGMLGQYNGYQKEQGVKPLSTTETWASVICAIDNPRWAGVPFILKTGKGMPKKETVIHIQFKTVDCLLMRGCPVPSNYLTIRIDPDAGFTLHLNAKKPGATRDLMPVAMDFCHSCLYALETPLAYEVLIEEVLRGTQSVVVRFDEIEHAWRLIDAIYAHKLPLYRYELGSEGPAEFDEFCQKHGIRIPQ